MLTFPSAPQHVRTRHKASANKRKSTFFFRARNPTHWLFSKSPKSSARASGAWRHSHPLKKNLLPGIFILTSLNETSSPRACEYLRSCLRLTQALSRKIISLTKHKGKIYKTKSLGHYITLLPSQSETGHNGNEGVLQTKTHPTSALHVALNCIW